MIVYNCCTGILYPYCYRYGYYNYDVFKRRLNDVVLLVYTLTSKKARHILSNYKTDKTNNSAEETTIQTFAVETSDRNTFTPKNDSTVLTETVETSDRN